MLNLRDYQRACLRTISDKRGDGVYKPLVALPTGTGKTVIFAYLIKATHGKSLVIVHRDELLRQAEEKLLIVDPGAEIGMVKAQKNELDAQVTIASVQSISRKKRLDALASREYELIVTDEAHHSVAPSYERVYDAVWKNNGGQIHLGVTATPNRTDQIGLKKVYDEVIFHKTLLDMIIAGWLCDLRCTAITTNIALDGVRTKAGDFAVNELASVINTANRNELIVKAYQENALGRKTLCFTVDVAHAHDLAEAFQKEGIRAYPLSGKTPLEVRRETLRQFHDGAIEVICNCQLLTEGFDEPALDCIVMARPTKSTTLFTQMIGRGTRSFPGKEDCLILDVTDMAGHHKVAQIPDLVGLKKEYKLDGTKTITQLAGAERREIGSMLRGRGISSSSVNIFMGSSLAWVEAGGKYILSLGQFGSIRVVPTKKMNGRYAVLHYPKGADSRFLSPKPVNLSWALGIADAEAEKITEGNLRLASKDAEWRGRPMTDSQIRILREKKVPFDKDMDRGQASDLITRIFAGGIETPKITSKSGDQLSFLDILAGKARE